MAVSPARHTAAACPHGTAAGGHGGHGGSVVRRVAVRRHRGADDRHRRAVDLDRRHQGNGDGVAGRVLGDPSVVFP